MNLTQEETVMLSEFLNRSEQLPTEMAVFAEKVKDEVVRLVDEAAAAAEAEAARIDGMSDAEVIAEAQTVVEDEANTAAVEDEAALTEEPEAEDEAAAPEVELDPKTESVGDGIGEPV